MEHEIACCTISEIGCEGGKAQFCGVGLWTDISVRLLDLPGMKELNKELLGGEIIPRSLIFAAFESNSHLLVGMGDGHLLNFSLDLVTN